jgi:hypothetical protein
MLRQVNELAANGLSPPKGKNGFARSAYLFTNLLKILAFSNNNMCNIEGYHLSFSDCF